MLFGGVLFLFGIYLFFVIEWLGKEYPFKAQDVTTLLDKYLLFVLPGYLAGTLIVWWIRKRKRMPMLGLALMLAALAAMVVGGYYLFIPRALIMTSWTEVK